MMEHMLGMRALAQPSAQQWREEVVADLLYGRWRTDTEYVPCSSVLQKDSILNSIPPLPPSCWVRGMHYNIWASSIFYHDGNSRYLVFSTVASSQLASQHLKQVIKKQGFI